MSSPLSASSSHQQRHPYNPCKIYVSNINRTVQEDDLRRKFSEYGVIKTLILKKKDKGYQEPKQAKSAIEEMNKADFFERTLRVEYAKGPVRNKDYSRKNYDRRDHNKSRERKPEKEKYSYRRRSYSSRSRSYDSYDSRRSYSSRSRSYSPNYRRNEYPREYRIQRPTYPYYPDPTKRDPREQNRHNSFEFHHYPPPYENPHLYPPPHFREYEPYPPRVMERTLEHDYGYRRENSPERRQYGRSYEGRREYEPRRDYDERRGYDERNRRANESSRKNYERPPYYESRNRSPRRNLQARKSNEQYRSNSREYKSPKGGNSYGYTRETEKYETYNPRRDSYNHYERQPYERRRPEKSEHKQSIRDYSSSQRNQATYTRQEQA